MKRTKPVAWQQKLVHEQIHILGEQATAVLIDTAGKADTLIFDTQHGTIAGVISIGLLAPAKDAELEKALEETLKRMQEKGLEIAPDTKESLKKSVKQVGLKSRPANHVYDLTPQERLRIDQVAAHMMRHPEIVSKIMEADIFWETSEAVIFRAQEGKPLSSIFKNNPKAEGQIAGVTLYSGQYSIIAIGGVETYIPGDAPMANLYTVASEELVHKGNQRFGDYEKMGDVLFSGQLSPSLVDKAIKQLEEWQSRVERYQDAAKGTLSIDERKVMEQLLSKADALYSGLPRYENRKQKFGGQKEANAALIKGILSAMEMALTLPQENYESERTHKDFGYYDEVFTKTYKIIKEIAEIADGRLEQVKDFFNVVFPPEKQLDRHGRTKYSITSLVDEFQREITRYYNDRYNAEEQAQAENYRKFHEQSVARRMA